MESGGRFNHAIVCVSHPPATLQLAALLMTCRRFAGTIEGDDGCFPMISIEYSCALRSTGGAPDRE